MNPKHLYKTEILYPLKNSWKYPPLRPCLASSSFPLPFFLGYPKAVHVGLGPQNPSTSASQLLVLQECAHT